MNETYDYKNLIIVILLCIIGFLVYLLFKEKKKN